jgi:hypothetical protein
MDMVSKRKNYKKKSENEEPVSYFSNLKSENISDEQDFFLTFKIITPYSLLINNPLNLSCSNNNI